MIHVQQALGNPEQSELRLGEIEREAEECVLRGHTLVSGIHNNAHQRAAIVPLRWGSPRILVLSGGFRCHMGENLDEEPFKAARLWRHKFDPLTDLVVSRRALDRKDTNARFNIGVDRLIERIVARQLPGILFEE